MSRFILAAAGIAEIATTACPIPGLPIAARIAQEIIKMVDQKDANNEALKTLTENVKEIVATVHEQCSKFIKEEKGITENLKQYVYKLIDTLFVINEDCILLRSQGRWKRFINSKKNQATIQNMIDKVAQTQKSFETKILMDLMQKTNTENARPSNKLSHAGSHIEANGYHHSPVLIANSGNVQNAFTVTG